MSPEEPATGTPSDETPLAPDEQLTIVASRTTTIAATGKRQSFRDIRRQLQEAELASPGVQRLLLEDLERAESDCDILQGYVERYHDADKRSAVLQEKLRAQTSNDILFAVGLSLGSVIIGFVPSLWDKTSVGPIALAIGVLLVGGSILARIVTR